MCGSFAFYGTRMTYFCTNCWKEIDKAASVCPACGSHQEQLGQESFLQKLIRALHHPEPETPIRAAYVLGELGASQAVDELSSILHSSPDPFIASACAEALGKIGGASALGALQAALNASRSIIVKRAVQAALQRHHHSEPVHG
jgi:HEAT repeat protein